MALACFQIKETSNIYIYKEVMWTPNLCQPLQLHFEAVVIFEHAWIPYLDI
jgi:hypothetical protein